MNSGHDCFGIRCGNAAGNLSRDVSKELDDFGILGGYGILEVTKSSQGFLLIFDDLIQLLQDKVLERSHPIRTSESSTQAAMP